MPVKGDRLTHCKRGHERIPENVYSSGHCKLCIKHNADSNPNRAAQKSAWQKENRVRVNELHRELRKKKPEKTRKWYREHYAANDDLNTKIAGCLRARLRGALGRTQKSGSAVDDLGCTIEEFKQWIYSQFEGGMGWDNHGEWHLDHVRPLVSFDLTDREQFLEACNWVNYQPLWAEENLTKGGRQ